MAKIEIRNRNHNGDGWCCRGSHVVIIIIIKGMMRVRGVMMLNGIIQ